MIERVIGLASIVSSRSPPESAAVEWSVGISACFKEFMSRLRDLYVSTCVKRNK